MDRKGQIISLILLFITVGILIYSEVSGSNLHLSFINGNQPTLHLEKKWLDIDTGSNPIFNVYYNDLIQCSSDGIKRISQDGNEIWNQTYSMVSPRLVVNEPYIVVAEEGGKKAYVLNDKGLLYEKTVEEPIIYFSISSTGYLSIIGETKDGHKIKAYDSKGNDIGIDRTTYIEDAGYPLCAIVSNDGNTMPISYLTPTNNKLKSNLIFLDLGDEGIFKKDLIDFGFKKEDTIIPTLIYLKNNNLVAIGDDRIIWIDENKKIKEEILNNRIQSIPWNIESKRNLSSYIVLALAEAIPGKQGKDEGSIIFYSMKGEKEYVFDAKGSVTYLYGDNDIVVVGLDRTFYGLDTKGKELFKYTALKDVVDILPLKNGKKLALISRDSVDLMEIKR
ncbi:MAG: hypothetical protein GX308_00755 [Epulopiscium sp.]|nr:hypothetical protein [Candidatus Epulonipiscium sp.]